ncbi:hypothetical protein B0H16DRAFT_1471284 [Mycena metata]|uniref:F-box domain-containing protein n=1 Tax=Mycena metata TaxID=1033252 RepID=A0AAD7MQQ6_9AGAR|nr:hypothetical protein B0H16DRAFT_1471284 [Mycena metata]
MSPFDMPILPTAEASAAQQRTSLVEIASTIDQCRKYLEQLEDMERGVKAALAAVKYPVLTLPNEITSRIFVGCLPNDGHVLPSPSAAPLLLAQICRHWRQVALSTCELWSSFHLPGSGDGSAFLLETWSTRAKGYLLSLTFSGRGHKLPQEYLRTISAQLQELKLLMLPGEQVRQLAHFPNLRYLELDSGGYCPPEANVLTEGDILHRLENSPCLQELLLPTLPVTAIPFIASLTSLEVFQATEVTTLLHVLTELPLLSNVIWSMKTTRDVASPAITLLQLRSLTLKQDNYDSEAISIITRALSLLTLPNLKRLCITEILDLDVLLSLVSRSACTLDYLDVNLAGCSPEQHLECLRACPCLTTLHLHLGMDGWDNNNLLTSLNSTLPTLLPQLRTMAISVLEHRIDYTLLIQMLRNVRLQSFRLEICKDYEQQCDYAFREPWPPWALEGEELAHIIAGGHNFSLECEDAPETLGRDMHLPPPTFVFLLSHLNVHAVYPSVQITIQTTQISAVTTIQATQISAERQLP